jgi:phosphoserine aminotransferase
VIGNRKATVQFNGSLYFTLSCFSHYGKNHTIKWGVKSRKITKAQKLSAQKSRRFYPTTASNLRDAAPYYEKNDTRK